MKCNDLSESGEQLIRSMSAYILLNMRSTNFIFYT